MSRLCWVFVLLAVAVPLSDARPHKCEQRERSIADLDLAEDALNKAKLLVPKCEENESSNSSECSNKDKSLGFIDAALDLVTSAKKNIPLCPHVPTEEPLTTQEPKPEVTPDDRHPTDCQELQAAGYAKSGVYTVWPRGKPVGVRCDMEVDGGGWTVIQRRGNFTEIENFDRNWNDYKNGFGNLDGEYWLGNDNIFALSNQGAYSLRLDMTPVYRVSVFAVYREFKIQDENANYRLHLDKYDTNSTAGDGMTSLTMFNNEAFHTKDRSNHPVNCAERHKGGFWYGGMCLNGMDCNPNGKYLPGFQVQDLQALSCGHLGGLLSFDMKLKRL